MATFHGRRSSSRTLGAVVILVTTGTEQKYPDYNKFNKRFPERLTAGLSPQNPAATERQSLSCAVMGAVFHILQQASEQEKC